jgi:DNA-binding NarL/FixJ family response regulator
MGSEGTITVAVGRFESLIGQGLLKTLEGDPGLQVLGAGLDHAALERAVVRRKARVVILAEDSVVGPSVPRRLSGATSRGVRIAGGSGASGAGLMVLAHRPSRAYALRVLACGVSVCLSTDASPREIVRGVRLAADGRHVFASVSPGPGQAGRAARIRSLTRREREVMELLGTGQKNAEIAQALQISTETARTHAKHVYRKLGIRSRAELLGNEA